MRTSSAQDVYETLRNRIDETVFQEIAGRSLEDVVFDRMSKDDDWYANEIWLDASEALRVGLVDEIYIISASQNSEEIEQIQSECPFQSYKIKYSLDNKTNQSTKPTLMTLEQFKKDHPELFNSITDNATKAERDRISTLSNYRDLDLSLIHISEPTRPY